MKNRQITAMQLRAMLSVSLFVIVALATLIASFGYRELKKVAVDVSHTTADANASQNTVQTLQKIQQKLASDQDVITRTNSIVADSKSYQYQDQILIDLNDYANRAGVTITNIDFSAAQASTPAPGAPAATAAPPAGVKSTSVSVTLKNPVEYTSLLRFIRSIEQNLTKMQISRISLAKGATGSDVSSEALTIEVYIR